MKRKRYLFTGERDWPAYRIDDIESAMVDLEVENVDSDCELVAVHGAARGFDSYVDTLALRRGWGIERFPVDHSIDGPWPAAGPRRSGRMVASGPFVECVAGWSGRVERSGTHGTIVLATRAAIPVRIIPRRKRMRVAP